MAILKPFKAVRPRKDLAFLVSCPPYDVLNVEEAKKMVIGNPYSFLHVTKPEVDFYDITDIDELYKIARKKLEKMIANNILLQDEEEKLYIYKQTGKDHVQTGIVGCFSIDEYQNGKIKKHELTRKEKEDDRTKHILLLNANTGLVFLTYRSNQKIKKLLAKICEKEPEYDFVSEDGVRNQIFLVEDNYIGKLREIFSTIDSLYIADGHHRAAAASRVREIKKEQNPNHTGDEEYNYFLAAVFAHDELKVFPYNRIVRNVDIPKKSFFDQLSKNFMVEKVYGRFEPNNRHVFGVYKDEEWYKFVPKDHIINEDDPVESLDVQILQRYVMDEIFGIKDPRNDERIDFIGGVKGINELEKLVDTENAEYAFSLYPTSIEDLIRIADNNLIMPPKSTWFEPKLRSGLFVHLLD